MRPCLKTLLLTLTLLFKIVTGTAFAQNADTLSVKSLIKNAENYFAKMPAEKLYLQLDKPYYTTGDTIWLKAYLFNAGDYSASQLSNKVYVELINDSSRVINRFAVPLVWGLGEGNLVLNDVTDGQYRIRAYTNWMQNFDNDLFYSKAVAIGAASPKLNWLIDQQHTLSSTATGYETNLALRLTDLSKMPVAYRDVEVKVLDGKKTIYKATVVTSDAGALSAKFQIPLKATGQNLSVLLTDKLSKNKLAFPLVNNNLVQNIDIQFMPEGGNIIGGLPGKVAFKAIGDDGLGIDVNGDILNNTSEVVARFQSTHLGMGSFVLMPVAGQSYRARVKLNGGQKDFALPAVRTSGLTLKVDNISSKDSVFVYIKATADVGAAKKLYKLIAHAKQGLYFGAVFNLNDGYTNIRLNKDRFPSGIVCFTILDGLTPLCERRIFVDRDDRLQLATLTNKPAYNFKDSVAVSLNVKDQHGKPVVASFSAAVTDDSYVTSDTYGDNIVSRLLITSELKGNVEQPAWYFAGDNITTQTALDNLLLTQGWTGYDFTKSLQPLSRPRFAAEPDNRVTGTLRGLFNKPQKNAKINMFSLSKMHGLMVFDTLSNAAGEFEFKQLPMLDTVAYTIRVTNSKGNESNATITLNDFRPADVGLYPAIKTMPWYTRANDSLMLRYITRRQAASPYGKDDKYAKGTLLKEVVIKSRKIVNEGRFNGYVKKEIDEAALVKAGKMSLYDVILAKDKTFGLRNAWRSSVFDKLRLYPNTNYTFGADLITDLVVDGNSAQDIFAEAQTGDITTYREFLSSFLRSLGADDVKDIKIVEDFSYYIMITTRSGKGLFSRSSPGIVFYKPVPLCAALQFYQPKYLVKNNTPLLPRPTIHWEPNLVTDKNGNATLSFYAADKPGSYTLILEGADMAGNFGYHITRINIGNKQPAVAKAPATK
ncbi:hypothetical protein [Mucilaginibacter sp.]|uniref:hypothetical protein n=1 Tax=Mucilaginibacter sp. TaxID=1882438 RepID=UPI0035BC3710